MPKCDLSLATTIFVWVYRKDGYNGSSPRAAVGHEPGHLLRLIAGVVPLLDSGPGISILKSVGRC